MAIRREGYLNAYSTGISASGVWAAQVLEVGDNGLLTLTIDRMSGDLPYFEVPFVGQQRVESGDDVWVVFQENHPSQPLAFVGSERLDEFVVALTERVEFLENDRIPEMEEQISTLQTEVTALRNIVNSLTTP